MKFITTLYRSRELEFTLTLSPRAKRDSDGKYVAENNSLVVHHVSKIGNSSLIFDPTVYLTIRSTSYENRLSDNATIPMNLIYRFAGMLTQVYNNMQGKGVFREDGGLFLDQRGAAAAARRMSTYRASITLYPDIIQGPDNSQLRGIGFQVDKNRIGAMPHNEVMALVDIMDHLDLATYSVVVGVLEGLHDIQSSNQQILERLARIEKLLMTNGPIQPVVQGILDGPRQSNGYRESSREDIFNWKSLDSGYGLGRS